MITLRNTFISAALLATAAAQSGGGAPQSKPFPGLRLEVKIQTATFSPMEPIDVDVAIINETTSAIRDVPILTTVNDNITFDLTYRGTPLAIGQAVARGPEKENSALTLELGSRARSNGKFTLLYDWDTGAFPFTKAGEYSVRLTAHSTDKQRAVVSNVASFAITDIAESTRLELQELHATEAYQYSIAPERILSDREAALKVKNLIAFRTAHPASPHITEFPFIVALYYDFKASVTHGEDEVVVKESARLRDQYLKEYITNRRGRHLAEAQGIAETRK
ncbi:MAG: hypothetical protein HY286_03475 [Planctomycetes bacterium]|nr:hypothetical protein [Planctomycetota bacterium]